MPPSSTHITRRLAEADDVAFSLEFFLPDTNEGLDDL